MLVFFSGRRLKPVTYDQFREAWQPEGDLPEGTVTIYHARNVKDENEVISFGLFDADRSALDEVRQDEAAELKRQDAWLSSSTTSRSRACTRWSRRSSRS